MNWSQQIKDCEIAQTVDSSLSSTTDYSCILRRRPMGDTTDDDRSILTMIIALIIAQSELWPDPNRTKTNYQCSDRIHEECRYCTTPGTTYACNLRDVPFILQFVVAAQVERESLLTGIHPAFSSRLPRLTTLMFVEARLNFPISGLGESVRRQK